MNTQSMTQQQISTTGVEILRQYMGVTGMIRFLQQREIGYGDYTKDRHKILGNPTLDRLISDIQSSDSNKEA